MIREEIKAAVEEQYLLLREAQECLKELRTRCPHENTFEGNYSWRVGSIQPAIICSDCGALIKIVTT